MTPSLGEPETIAAIATPAGRGAVGIVRISGRETERIAGALLGAIPPPRSAALRRLHDAEGEALDEGLVMYFPRPASFTGESVLEIQGHGGPVVLDRVLQRVLSLGARMARPGEFTERAFLNGKLDLSQAEAVADLIDAGTVAAARAALRSLQGEFSARVRGLQSALTELRVYVEAAIDFPDEEIELLSGPEVQGRVSRLFAAFAAITAAARQGALLRDGLHVVIAGPPNAGKSRLLNRLVGDDVAIVNSVPGTTRDVLRQSIEVDGLRVNLADTAGLRTVADLVEQEGIRRARTEISRADRVLYVWDSSTGPLPNPAELRSTMALPAAVPVTWVMNKIDVLALDSRRETGADGAVIYLSAETGAGMELLRHELKMSAGELDAEAGAMSARRRHLDALGRAQASFERAAGLLGPAPEVELFAEELRLAQRSLSEITGEVSSEDLLGEIFGSFCIGK